MTDNTFSDVNNPRYLGNNKSRWKKWKESFPTLAQWKKLRAILSVKEQMALVVLFTLFLGSSGYLLRAGYFSVTTEVPSQGGKLIEGMVGYPRAINPITADTSDVDRDLLSLLYEGLFSLDEQGNIVPELVEHYEVQGDGTIIELTLKQNLRWSDGTFLTADDVIFTIEAIQNPKYNSPIQRNWVGIEIEKISDLRIQLHLRKPFAPLLERLTLKPLPKHIWGTASPETLHLSTSVNLQPVGSGPYIVKKVERNSKTGLAEQLQLEPNPYYNKQTPLIPSITVKFFPNEEELQKAAKSGSISNFALDPGTNITDFLRRSRTVHEFSLPRYFALFFNLQPSENKELVGNKDARHALQAALNKEAIVYDIFGEYGVVVSSPFLPNTFKFGEAISSSQDAERALVLLQNAGFRRDEQGAIVKITQGPRQFQSDLTEGMNNQEVLFLQECLAQDKAVYPEATVSGFFGPATKLAVARFQEKYSSEILAPSGLSRGTGTVGVATRAKLNELCGQEKGETEPVQLQITVPGQPTLLKIADQLKTQWEEFGIPIEIRVVTSEQLINDIIPVRDYQALLFGEILGIIPDPLPFWHSSQIGESGFNLSLYENEDVDALLEQMRAVNTVESRNETLGKLQTIFLEDLPAIPLYDTSYLYITPRSLQGIHPMLISDPSQRFSQVEYWYMETKRVRK